MIITKRIAPLILLLGASFFMIAMDSFFSTRSFLERAEVVLGEVVSFIEKENFRGDIISYTASIDFIYKEKEHSFKDSRSSKSPRYDVGEKVEILIDNKDVKNIKMKNFLAIWGTALVFCILSLGAFFGGIYSFIKK